MPITVEHVTHFLTAAAALIHERRDELTALDAAIGDADHGANLDRGFTAVMARLPSVADKDIGTVLKTTGMTIVSTVGGASGPLYGTAFVRAGMALADRHELSTEEVLLALEAALDGIVARGKAQRGEKTMVDALAPAIEALRAALAAGEPLGRALQAAADAAEGGAKATIPMLALKGRASYLGERSIGHQDPGATSTAYLLRALAMTCSRVEEGA
ncbi:MULTISPECIES: dihydroxyacetone kinase subunit DhaL [Chloroflexus]|jgi:dihydroxyacetone kinase-like protein|uniref:Dihydroxyacetone kinase, L subunit n=1 Tax=Chloroflexus aggregans (strain MD-66 / DSM 9485) TaxID=326427 RepID=B8GBS5_CHLAD|nr:MULTISPECIES: dihydroxyacetone kinase subunit DhaL [Chloroflexus]ACL24892.1 dihydroxyacetone kinase, L subunit [Chloroflexus aggregans DSM 9485]GIV88846.1 MAG: dihydroxyacetone kinase subunit L [Chloroflexus sp.]